MIIKNYLTTDFLFSGSNGFLQTADKFFVIIGLFLLALAAVFKLSAIFAPTPVDEKFRQRLFNLFVYIGFSEVVWYGLRSQNVRFFGSHFVALLILLIGLVWFIFLIVNIFQKYNMELLKFKKEQVRLKYLKK